MDIKNKVINRDIHLDLIRAACTLYIIGVWHFNEYLADEMHFQGIVLSILHCVTKIALGLFVLISGYCLRKYSFSCISDCLHFLKNRAKRFLFPLLISAFLFLLSGRITRLQFVGIVFGFNMFGSDAAPTLWFFSMMVLFYELVPLIRWRFQHKRLTYLVVFALLMIFVLLNGGGYIDNRLLLYYPCFIVGLFFPSTFTKQDKKNKFLAVIALLFSNILFVVGEGYVEFAVTIGVMSLFMLTRMLKLGSVSKFSTGITYLSYGSMMAYLFHRQYFSIVRSLCRVLFLKQYIPIVIAYIALIILFLLSYRLQLLYDKLLNLIFLGKK